MKVLAKTGREDIAMVYLAETTTGKLIEFAESLQPPLPIERKWVLTISTLYGCPVGCRFCDAGGWYEGRISKDDIIAQIDFLIKKRFLNNHVYVEKFKIQFARIGEPSYNPYILEVLDSLVSLYDAPGLIISFSTIAPNNTDNFFKKLIEIKNKNYVGRFQFQYSLHTTDEKLRDWLIPMKKWTFKTMSEYGKSFYKEGDRKITLNFALADGMPVDPNILLKYFPPNLFLIKVTPINPTHRATRNRMISMLPHHEKSEIFTKLRNAGYEVILSIGESEENLIGSNCGQYITAYKKTGELIEGGYTYPLQKI